MSKADWAAEVARKLLEVPLPRRWAHVQGVAAQARSLAPILGDDADLLEAAAWLHDIGYSPELVETGFHPLDGARYLRDAHFADPVLCSLVAHHSCAIVEAGERGVADVLSLEFEPSPHLLPIDSPCPAKLWAFGQTQAPAKSRSRCPAAELRRTGSLARRTP